MTSRQFGARDERYNFDKVSDHSTYSQNLNVDMTKGSFMPSKAIVCFKDRDHVANKPLEIDGSVCAASAEGHLGIDAIVGVLHLPNPPKSIQTGVVEVKDGIAGRDHRVAAGVAARDVMTRVMDAPIVRIASIHRWRE